MRFPCYGRPAPNTLEERTPIMPPPVQQVATGEGVMAILSFVSLFSNDDESGRKVKQQLLILGMNQLHVDIRSDIKGQSHAANQTCVSLYARARNLSTSSSLPSPPPIPPKLSVAAAAVNPGLAGPLLPSPRQYCPSGLGSRLRQSGSAPPLPELHLVRLRLGLLLSFSSAFEFEIRPASSALLTTPLLIVSSSRPAQIQCSTKMKKKDISLFELWDKSSKARK
ncbi:uncharacterized protein [Triticum aestivum]|uniref:uncharacterized protein n=1 Tax=Triticum aestivum TaxID=4565 RepID=UPI001D01F26D|nr:uncharacterized protein LOC123079566 [Triticum aestivum]